MANEPERPIEKLLRASAKRRRDDAGAPFELHPATRRLLQGEVARKFGKPQQETRSFSEVLGQWWPRFAWGVGIFAVLALTVYVLLPEPGKGNREALLAKNEPMPEARQAKVPLPPPPAEVAAAPAPPAPSAQANPSEVTFADKDQAAPRSPARRLGSEREQFATDSLAAPLDGAARDKQALAAAAQLADRQKDAEMGLAVSGGLPAQAPAGAVNGTLERRYGLAGKPASSAGLPVAPASPAPVAATPPAATFLAADESAKLTGEKFDQPAVQYKSLAKAASANRPTSSPMAADGPSKAAADALKKSIDVAFGQRFVQVAPEEKAKNGFADRSTPAHPVLASFQLEQAGRELRIVDGDGSVYSGYVRFDDATRRAPSIKAESPAAARATRAPAGAFEEKSSASFDSDRVARQTYSFRVSGTNRSLNKQVVFTGNLLAATNLTSLLPVATNLGIEGGPGAFRNAPAQQGSLPLLNSRISGKVVIGSGKAVEINALPASP